MPEGRDAAGEKLHLQHFSVLTEDFEDASLIRCWTDSFQPNCL